MRVLCYVKCQNINIFVEKTHIFTKLIEIQVLLTYNKLNSYPHIKLKWIDKKY